MKMKTNLKKTVSIAMLLGTTSLAHAAGQEGHGGGAFVWRNAMEITKVKLWDLYYGEIDAQSPKTYNHSYANPGQVIDLAKQRLKDVGSQNFLYLFSNSLETVETAWNPLPRGESPAPANDADLPTSGPVGSHPEYLVNYSVRNGVTTLYVENDYMSGGAFPPVEQGALKIHEAVYAVTRTAPWNATDSVLAQEIVSLLVADTLTSDQQARLRTLTTIYQDEPEILGMTLEAQETLSMPNYRWGLNFKSTSFHGAINKGDQFQVISFSPVSDGFTFVFTRKSDGAMFDMSMTLNEGATDFSEIFNVIQ
jgi:hypothetical protein